MKVLIGLGNPGERYKYNRHNIGFSVVDDIAEKYSQTTWVKKFHGKYCQCWAEGKKFLLLKPETYMNNSGQSVASIIAFYKLTINDIIVLHDDLDLKVGQIKIKRSGGHAGHNGIRSIHQSIGEQYTRVKIGIGHPGNKDTVSSYVLSNFTELDNIQLASFVKECVLGINDLISGNYNELLSSISSAKSATTQRDVEQLKISKPNKKSPNISS
jgi:PTH1 family peptidyl-tRNA hydrolase